MDEFIKRNLDVSGFYFTFNSDRIRYKIASLYGYNAHYILSKLHPLSIGAAILSRKKSHDAIGGFDETYYLGEDNIYSRNIKNSGGKYGLIRSTKILYSVRRFEKEGLWNLLVKWHYVCLYYILHGSIKKEIVPYEFGKY